MNTLSYSDLRTHLSATMDKVVNNHEAIIITRSKRESVVMLSLDDYQSMQETTYLLRNPHNAQHLLQSVHQVESGQTLDKTLAELDTLAQ